MFGSRQTGAVFTSVRLHPIKLLIFGVVTLMVGLVMIVGDKLWGIPVGFVLALAGARLIFISGRQAIRGVRTFLS